MNLKKIGILILCLGMLLPLGCSPDDRPDVGTVYLEPDTEHVTVEGNTNTVQPMKQPDASCTPIPLAAETTPYAPRDPREDDVSKERFPNYDTGVDADYSYQSDELRIAIKKYTDEDEGQIYYVADIWMRSLNCFRMGFAHGKYNTGHEDPASFAQRDNVIFGVSGSFNKGLVIHNGEKTKGVEDNLIGFTSGIMVVYRDGTVKMIDRNQKEKFNYSKENKSRGGVLHALQFGPILLNDGKIPAGLKKNERHPRIIFGYYEPGHYAAVAVDGRRKKAIGMTETEMAELMQRLGCVSAMNLDGGTSAVMLFMGRTINTPSGVDGDGDGIAGRNIVDMLEFAEYDANGNAASLTTVRPSKFLGE